MKSLFDMFKRIVKKVEKMQEQIPEQKTILKGDWGSSFKGHTYQLSMVMGEKGQIFLNQGYYGGNIFESYCPKDNLTTTQYRVGGQVPKWLLHKIKAVGETLDTRSIDTDTFYTTHLLDSPEVGLASGVGKCPDSKEWVACSGLIISLSHHVNRRAPVAGTLRGY